MATKSKSKKKTEIPADVLVTGFGSTLIQLHLLTQAAKDWVEENVEAEPYQFLGRALCVEPRYVADIVRGMRAAGLEVV